MKIGLHIITLKFFAILLVGCLCCGQMSFAQGKKFNAPEPSEWSGTGWLLNQGYVVTNHHVAENARTIVLKFQHGEQVSQYDAQVVLTDAEHDLALLKVNDANFLNFIKNPPPYTLEKSLADVGESVFVLGYPLTSTMGDEIKLTTGIIASHSGYQGDKSQYQISAPVQPGNSGGPLFDSKGNIVGIVSAKHTGAENVSYAIKASFLDALLNRLPDKSDIIPTSNKLSELDLPQQVKQVKDYVCFIYCSSVGTISYDTKPTYVPSSPAGTAKVVKFPYVDSGLSDLVRILSVTLTNSETIVEIECSSINPEVNYEWIAIDGETVIETEMDRYRLRRAEGIAIAPEKTVYTKQGETKVFKLYFPQLPPEVTSFSLIEPKGWRFYGISLKE